MSDDRRQKYEEAIRQAKGIAGIFGNVSLEVDAVMAVADEERNSDRFIATMAVANLESEIARLRKELTELENWAEWQVKGE